VAQGTEAANFCIWQGQRDPSPKKAEYSCVCGGGWDRGREG
jgi:hypothetical protein